MTASASGTSAANAAAEDEGAGTPRKGATGSDPELHPSESGAQKLNSSVIRFYEKVSMWEDVVAGQVGLTPRQCHVIAELGAVGRIRMKPLSERLGITTGTLTIMADRLEKLGILRRVADAADRRAFNIELTESGTALYLEHEKHHEALASELLSALGKDEVDAFISQLDRLCSVL